MVAIDCSLPFAAGHCRLTVHRRAVQSRKAVVMYVSPLPLPPSAVRGSVGDWLSQPRHRQCHGHVNTPPLVELLPCRPGPPSSPLLSLPPLLCAPPAAQRSLGIPTRTSALLGSSWGRSRRVRATT